MTTLDKALFEIKCQKSSDDSKIANHNGKFEIFHKQNFQNFKFYKNCVSDVRIWNFEDNSGNPKINVKYLKNYKF